ncbi:MAG: hypothetical protein ACHQJ5_10495 [Vicinamibacteria bacterium]
MALVAAGSSESAAPTVTISGRAYAFNHSDTGLAGATIRVRELPGVSAVADGNGDYVISVPDETNVTPYIDPPPGYHQIDLQTFHTRGKPIENANFQTPGDFEYNGLAALLSVPLGPDGRPEQCVIVTTASARNVRGVDFATFQARTPHGVAGATARGNPGLPGAIYFNDSVIPDRSRTTTSGDGGIIFTEIPAGTYRVITESPTASFASFLATCEPGRIVNANPPWGAYELVGKEKPLGAGIIAGKVARLGRGTKAGHRLVIIAFRTAESLGAKVALHQHGRRVSPVVTRAGMRAGSDKIPLRVSNSADAGRAKLSVKLTDGAGDSVTEKLEVRLPPEP